RQLIDVRVIETVIRELGQPPGVAARPPRLVEAPQGTERLSPAPLQLDHEVSIRRDAQRHRKRLVVASQGAIGHPAVEVQLAQKLGGQDPLALERARARLLERREEQPLGLLEAPLETSQVPETNEGPGQAEVVPHLETHLMRLGEALGRTRPVAALLLDDAEIEQ